MAQSQSVIEDTAAGTGAARWWEAPWKTMADLAEAVDDLICSFDYMDTAMDNLVMLIFIWILFSIVLLGIAKWAYSRFANKVAEVDTKQKATVEEVKKTSNEIINSADSVLVTSAKVKSASFKPAKPTGFVPATPPNKRRLGRMSPGPEQLTLKKHQSIIVPTCTGPDPPSVQWVNDLLTWLYNDLVIVNELVQQWIVSMNEFSKKSVEEQGIGVELVRALDSHPPSISNVFCECDSKDDVTITCDCEATPAFQLKAFSQRGEKVEVSHYRVNVNRFRARLNVVCVTDKLTGELKCDGWPEVKVALAPVGALRPNATENDLQQTISDIVVSALRSTNLQFNLAHYPTCPRLRRYVETPGPRLPLHYDSMLQQDRQMYTSTPNSTAGSVTLLGDKRLLVKLVCAKDLGGKTGCVAPYCVVEMDEPPQKNQTAFKKDTNNPQWEEHFLFDLSPQTAELLFEVYDRTGPPSPGGGPSQHRFLGLGLVGIDELLAAPSQRQQIALQTRPMEDHDVSGTLTVEFLFIEGADIPDLGSRPVKIKESLRTLSPHGHLTTTTKTIFKQNGHDNSQLTESALRELELSPTNAANKSTLIIHSVQREPKKSIKQGDYVQQQNENVPPEPAPRKRRRDFFGTIKRRLGRSRTRGASLDLTDSEVENQSRIRSISAERNAHEKALSIPNRNVYSAGASPAQSGDESRTSRRSSLSEVSGFSTASARTFIHEASTLVLETIEAGIKKHYLVPLTIAQRSRWRRKGIKLHIYNEHTFIAKHLSGGTVCEVCTKTIARRLGKQGYECRDCMLKCHKHCHVKVATNCPRSTVHNMELTYIASPYADKNIRML
ncbi:phospholipid transfer protein C2CD2L isoform X6 [Spodoptera frugiperda]|uniref:Phospholipid transfer protein C2CD2L isoform X6 n=1 Tax=Spodoptera frugiperda TaxID=7108 RepID=A0A9R0DZ02_SPOFR|nr:phospholipid transfer protein C2CD2L isoform X6 [Spodoptera frugiperda]